MLSMQRTTVALSMTESDVEVIRYAALLAKLGISTEFRFVHVSATSPESDAASVQATHVNLAEQVVQHFGVPRAGEEVSCHVLSGSRIDSLIEFVGNHQSGLILLGHRKRRSGRRSLARRLAEIAPAAVWMVPEGARCQITSVIAPVDFSEHSADALSEAAAIASRQGLRECQALYVYFDPSTLYYDEGMAEDRRNERHAFAEFMENVNRHGVTIEPVFEESPQVADAILRVAHQRGADLLVMSTRGRSQAASILLGSTTSQVMMECDIPILIVKNYGSHMNLFEALRDSRFWERSDSKSN